MPSNSRFQVPSRWLFWRVELEGYCRTIERWPFNQPHPSTDTVASENPKDQVLATADSYGPPDSGDTVDGRNPAPL